jgi:hypothetical protein
MVNSFKRDAVAERMKFRTGVLPFFFGCPGLPPVLQKGWDYTAAQCVHRRGAEPSPWTGRRIQIVSESSCVPEWAAGLKPGAYIGLRWITWLGG